MLPIRGSLSSTPVGAHHRNQRIMQRSYRQPSRHRAGAAVNPGSLHRRHNQSRQHRYQPRRRRSLCAACSTSWRVGSGTGCGTVEQPALEASNGGRITSAPSFRLQITRRVTIALTAARRHFGSFSQAQRPHCPGGYCRVHCFTSSPIGAVPVYLVQQLTMLRNQQRPQEVFGLVLLRTN